MPRSVSWLSPQTSMQVMCCVFWSLTISLYRGTGAFAGFGAHDAGWLTCLGASATEASEKGIKIRIHSIHNFERPDSRVRAVNQEGEHRNSAGEAKKRGCGLWAGWGA